MIPFRFLHQLLIIISVFLHQHVALLVSAQETNPSTTNASATTTTTGAPGEYQAYLGSWWLAPLASIVFFLIILFCFCYLRAFRACFENYCCDSCTCNPCEVIFCGCCEKCCYGDGKNRDGCEVIAINISERAKGESIEDYEKRKNAGGYFDTQTMQSRDDLGRNHPSSPFFDRSSSSQPQQRHPQFLSPRENGGVGNIQNKAVIIPKRGVQVLDSARSNDSSPNPGTARSRGGGLHSARSEDIINYSIYDEGHGYA